MRSGRGRDGDARCRRADLLRHRAHSWRGYAAADPGGDSAGDRPEADHDLYPQRRGSIPGADGDYRYAVRVCDGAPGGALLLGRRLWLTSTTRLGLRSRRCSPGGISSTASGAILTTVWRTRSMSTSRSSTSSLLADDLRLELEALRLTLMLLLTRLSLQISLYESAQRERERSIESRPTSSSGWPRDFSSRGAGRKTFCD